MITLKCVFYWVFIFFCKAKKNILGFYRFVLHIIIVKFKCCRYVFLFMNTRKGFWPTYPGKLGLYADDYYSHQYLQLQGYKISTKPNIFFVQRNTNVFNVNPNPIRFFLYSFWLILVNRFWTIFIWVFHDYVIRITDF